MVGAWSSLYNHLLRTGMGAITTLAMAAIDTALWEARALASERPLFLEMGGHGQAVPAYTSGIDLHLGPEELFEVQRREQARGYGWFKIKVGKPRLDDDVARVAAAREAIGPDARLVLDANQGWDPIEAVRRCRAFERYDITWIEEPLAPDDVQGHADLRRRTDLPIAVGESLYTVEAFRNYLVADAVDIIQADIPRVGGITPWMRIADLAAAWHKPVAPHFFIELSVHALCAVDNGMVLENVRGGSLHDLGLTKDPVSIENGMASPPAAPGHGVQLALAENATFVVPDAGYSFSDVRSHKE